MSDSVDNIERIDMKSMLTLDAIEQIEDVTEEDFFVSAWNGYVKIRSITKRQMRDIKKKARDKNDEIDNDLMEKEIFMKGLVSPAVTTDEQYEHLLDKSAAAMESILGAIVKNSKMGKGDQTAAEKTFRS